MPNSALGIEDLTVPELNPMQREVLAQLETLSVDLDPPALIEEAIEKTGLDDFGSDDFHPRLRAYAGAVDADSGNTNLKPLSILRNRIVRLLSQRLLLTDLLRRYPEIHDIEIERPIIVVGLPRSGTTHLVNLIASDARRRALPLLGEPGAFPAAWGRPRRQRSGPEIRAQCRRAPSRQWL